MSRAIVTVGVSHTRAFGPYLDRFEKTMREYGCADEIIVWREWPTGSPTHEQSHYAFKTHAVCDAVHRGHDQVLWLDCSAYAIRSLEPMWGRIVRDGHALVSDVILLGNWSADHALEQFGLSRDDAMNIKLMCGTCWGVDLTNERSRRFVLRLRELATPENFNGTHQSRLLHKHPRSNTEGAVMSDDERCWGHRSDEVYMTLLARELGMETHVGEEFVGGALFYDKACIRSGYDL